jgi:hypothetical protein
MAVLMAAANAARIAHAVMIANVAQTGSAATVAPVAKTNERNKKPGFAGLFLFLLAVHHSV